MAILHQEQRLIDMNEDNEPRHDGCGKCWWDCDCDCDARMEKGRPHVWKTIPSGRYNCLICGKYLQPLLSDDSPEYFPLQPENQQDTIAAMRKATPLFSGCYNYFPKALAAIARVSLAGNEQHNPGSPLHWDRSKSGDELDAAARHMQDCGKLDSDGHRHSAKFAWRALANLEKEIEAADEQRYKDLKSIHDLK